MRELREPYAVRLVRGDLTGVVPALLRLLLAPPSWVFAAAAEVRVALFRIGVFTSHRVPCPVVSVGNLTVGGTGKTPLVEWVVREIRLFGLNPVVLSRGYRAAPGETPDEIRTLAENLSSFRYVVDPDRVRGALTAIERHYAEALVLDDGFQHLRLARQLDLVTVDATAPFGGGHCLPRGMLREPVRGLRRAHAVILTRTDQVPPDRLVRIRNRLRRVAPRAVVCTSVHRPRGLHALGGEETEDLRWLEGRRVYLACAIGNPWSFETTVRRLGAVVAGCARLPDHHPFGEEETEAILAAAREAGAEAVITTQKDAARWNGKAAGGPPLYWLGIGLEILSGREELRGLIRSALKGGSKAG